MKLTKKILSNIGEYKGHLIATPFFVVLECLIDLLIPLYVANIINEAQKGNLIQIYKNGGILMGFAVLALIFGTLSGYTAAHASAGLARNLRNGIFDKIQRLSFLEIDKFSVSSLVTRMTTDIGFIQQAFQVSIRGIIRSPIMIVLAIVLSFTVSPKFAVFYLVAAISVFLITLVLFKIIHPRYIKLFKEFDRLNLITEENLAGIREVKAYGKEDKEIGKFFKVSKRIRDLSVSAEKVMVIATPFMGALVYLIILGIESIAGMDVINKDLELGSMTSLLAYVIQLFVSLMRFVVGLVFLIIAKTSAIRVTEILDAESSITEKADAIDKVDNGSIEFKDVIFGYKVDAEETILNNVNFKIESGETIGIIGATGSAKSTIVQLIPRFYDVMSGQVLVGGHDVKDYKLNVLRDNVAMVLQKNSLFSGTLRENMKWGKEDATDEEIWNALKVACAYDFIKQKEEGLDLRVEKGGLNFSGGQRQRLCIARALLKSPKILIFDDSTSAVDTKTDATIRENLNYIQSGVTKIIIAQRINSLQHSDRIIVLDNGSIVGFDTHDNLIKDNVIYKEIFESQMTLDGGLDNE